MRPYLSGVLLVALSVGVASCASGPSDADRAVCSAAGVVLGAPPNSGVAVNTQAIVGGAASADSGLATASKAWDEALRRQDQPSENRALVQVEMACMRLGIWQVHD